ncbi:MAG: N-acetylmuramoyl-L-alanine amidase [Silicimonas sp.]|nr:N-acetylmuramoyl-L-alanine amidase [Silicimonas sp.]
MSRFFTALTMLALFAFPGSLFADARVAEIGKGGVRIEDQAGEVFVTIPLSQAVPWRVFLADNPPRFVVEFNDVVFDGAPDVASISVAEIVTEKHTLDGSRLVAILREPLAIAEAVMDTQTESDEAVLRIRLSATTAADFREAAEDITEKFVSADEPPTRMVVAIDPGHGGIDPGTEAGDMREADLMLAFAKRLREDLVRSGHFDVVLTREDDSFVPLETRLTLARQAKADVFLSLHADALTSDAGSASGLTVYTLAPEAGDEATQRLTERHGATDILTGVDLSGAGDDVAHALSDLARRDTSPRAEAMAVTLISAAQAAELAVNSRPHRKGDFAVLKAADIPSVLIELGFLSSAADRARLGSEKWLQEATRALRDGLLRWQDEDRLLSDGLRK